MVGRSRAVAQLHPILHQHQQQRRRKTAAKPPHDMTAGRRSQSSGCVGVCVCVVVQAMKSLRTRWLEGSGVAFFHASYIFRPEKKGKEKVRQADRHHEGYSPAG